MEMKTCLIFKNVQVCYALALNTKFFASALALNLTALVLQPEALGGKAGFGKALLRDFCQPLSATFLQKTINHFLTAHDKK